MLKQAYDSLEHDLKRMVAGMIIEGTPFLKDCDDPFSLPNRVEKKVTAKQSGVSKRRNANAGHGFFDGNAWDLGDRISPANGDVLEGRCQIKSWAGSLKPNRA